MKSFLNKGTALLLCVYLLLSCSSNDNDTSLENRNGTTFTPISEYLQDMSVLKGEGSILLQSNEAESIQDNERNIDISQMQGNLEAMSLYDTNGEPINISDCNSNIECKRSLYGSVLNLKIEGKEEQLYIPKLIKMDFRKDVIDEGTVIQWNSDPNNLRGVVVWISYNPLYQLNSEIFLKYTKLIDHATSTSDSGSYTLTKKDLEKFPKNSILDITILRTNYIINKTEKPSFIAFTQVYKRVHYISK